MVYIYLADGFEEIEALTVVDVLRRAGADARTVSLMKDLTVTGSHNVPVVADMLFEDASYEQCEMLVLPGGPWVQGPVGRHEGLAKALADFAGSGGWVAAICAAPLILARQGLLDGRSVTMYDGMESELAGGAVYKKEDVVRDGNIVSSRGPGTAMDFALALAELLAGAEAASEARARLLY
jgi:4-methyl-5(b-hydroxyethyl)-thiazole monophosphate biosynthesis